MQRSTGATSKHPLILRLKAIAREHRKKAQQEKANMRSTPKEHPAIRAFYFDAAAAHIQAATLIEDALRDFPISLHANALKGGRR